MSRPGARSDPYAIDRRDFESVAYRSGDAESIGALVSSTRPNGAGVVLFPEWWGLDDYALWRGSRFADLGYTVFVADMYGEGIVTADVGEAAALAADTRTGPEARARANAALDTFVDGTGIGADKVAAVGYCFGGSVALELARSGADVRGVVACHASLATPLPASPGDITASIMVLHGGADPLVPDDDITRLAAEMDEAGADWQLVVYGGAQHSFTRPDADRLEIEGVSYHRQADFRSWAAIEAFLSEVLHGDGGDGN